MHTYEQTTGRWNHGTLNLGTGYSGNGQWKNDPASENVPDHGPIPKGFYTIGPIEDSAKLGKIIMQLIPDPSNQMYGRSGFFLHGDSIEHPGSASDGCIIQGLTCRSTVAMSQDRRLQVV